MFRYVQEHPQGDIYMHTHTHRAITTTLHAISTSTYINTYIASTLTEGSVRHTVTVDSAVKLKILNKVTTEQI
jgi:hypothetical protein